MGNCITLNVTNLDSASEALADDDFSEQLELLSRRGDVPALLWMVMFRPADWKETYDAEGYKHQIPFLSINAAIENLENARAELDEVFHRHGGLSSSIDDLISRLEAQKHKNVYIWTLGGSVDEDLNSEMIVKINNLSNINDKSLLKKQLASYFCLYLTKKIFFKRKFVAPSLLFREDTYQKYDAIDQWNVSSIVGVGDSEASCQQGFGW